MIHYNVWFSFKEGASEPDQLQRVRVFLSDLKSRGLIHEFQILKNRAAAGRGKLAKFHALIVFRDNEQLGPPFSEVTSVGIHAGKHGFMIESVSEFIVEVFDEIPSSVADLGDEA